LLLARGIVGVIVAVVGVTGADFDLFNNGPFDEVIFLF
jgi:hypothetical protein